MSEAGPPVPLRLAFARGTAPSKWAERWRAAMPGRPLELVPFDRAFGRPPEAAERPGSPEIDDEPPYDVVLERCAPGARPEGSDSASAARPRHAVRLYEEAVALVLPRDHELSELGEILRDDLALVTLLDHPDHAPDWPAPRPWDDDAWMPADLATALELVASGLGGLLAPLPLARHLAGRREHAVLRVVDGAGGEALPGSAIWATWRVDRDAPDVQQLVGIMRGRTARSSREGAPSAGSPVAAQPRTGGAPRQADLRRTGPRKIAPARGRPPGGKGGRRGGGGRSGGR